MGVKHYDESFKVSAVRLYFDRGNISQVAKELDLEILKKAKAFFTRADK